MLGLDAPLSYEWRVRQDQGPRGSLDRSEVVLLAVIVGLVILLAIVFFVFRARNELI